MAFRAKAAAFCFVGALFLRAEVSVDVRHDHLRKEGHGRLTATDEGLAYAEDTGKKDHSWSVKWNDVQQLFGGAKEIRVVTYADSRWRLGADHVHTLEAVGDLQSIYAVARERLGTKFVEATAEEVGSPLWDAPVKLRKGFGGSEGVLAVGADVVAYRSKEKDESRTWRYADIDNVSSSGPFDLTFTTFERSKGSYGDRRSFSFQLKQPLDEKRYQALWRRLNESKQLDILKQVQE